MRPVELKPVIQTLQVDSTDHQPSSRRSLLLLLLLLASLAAAAAAAAAAVGCLWLLLAAYVTNHANS